MVICYKYFWFVLHKLTLTNLACSNHAGEYWNSLSFVQSRAHILRRPWANIPQFTLTPPSVSKRLLIAEARSKVILQDQNQFTPLPSSRRLSRFVIVSSPASRTLVSSSFVSSTSSGIIILCVLSSLLKMSRFHTQSTDGKRTSQLVAGISNSFKGQCEND